MHSSTNPAVTAPRPPEEEDRPVAGAVGKGCNLCPLTPLAPSGEPVPLSSGTERVGLALNEDSLTGFIGVRRVLCKYVSGRPRLFVWWSRALLSDTVGPDKSHPASMPEGAAIRGGHGISDAAPFVRTPK